VTAGTATRFTTLATTGNGAANIFSGLTGTTGTKLLWSTASVPLIMTSCTVSRYTDTIGNTIFNTKADPYTNSDVYLGHYNTKRGVAYYSSFRTNSATASIGPSATNWLVMCGNTDATNPNNVFIDQLAIGTWAASYGTAAGQLQINMLSTMVAAFEIHSVYIWPAVLSATQMKHVTTALRAQIGGTPDIANNQVGPAVTPMTPAPTAYEQVCAGGTNPDAATGDCKIPCLAGTYSADGYTPCTSCPAGTWSAALGAVSAATCTNCLAGKYSTTEGATAIGICMNCGTGTYSDAGAGTCTSCPPGTWSATVGAATCTSCPEGTWSATVGATTCTNCVAGTYSTAVGATDISTCTSCDALLTSSAGSSYCICIGGYARYPDPLL
jgi:Tyrosine-protein kinase ephrin type A/B receptor-like